MTALAAFRKVPSVPTTQPCGKSHSESRRLLKNELISFPNVNCFSKSPFPESTRQTHYSLAINVNVLLCTYKKYLGMLNRLDTVKDCSQSCQNKSKHPTSLMQKKRKNVRD